MKRREFYQARSKLKGSENLALLLRVARELEDAGWIKVIGNANDGKPDHWRINPAIHIRYAKHAEREKIERPIRQRRLVEALEASAALRDRGSDYPAS